MKKVILFILTICVFTHGQAQEQNIFLDRTFWKSNPSINTIEEKIKEGNNVTQLNPHGFDAVGYAILEKVDNKTIQHLLSKDGNGVNKLTHDKRTYVFWAAYKNNVELMKYLISKGARMDLKDAHHFSPLTFAATTGQTNKAIYELCLEHKINIKTDLDEHGANALLLIASHTTDYKLIEYFESKGLSVSDKDASGNGIFAYAAKYGNKELLETLILNGITAKSDKNTMLFATYGSRKGYNSLDFIKYLENNGVAVNVKNKDGVNPLNQLAYKCNDIAMLQYFVDKGVAPDNQENKEGHTPLVMAGYANTNEAIDFFLNLGAKINTKNKQGHSVLTNAVRYNTPEVVAHLIDKGADVSVLDSKGNHLGYELVKSYNTRSKDKFAKKLDLLVNNKLDLTKPLADKNTLVHLAVESNNVALLKALERFNIDINAKNSDGNTALHIAAMTNKNDTVLKYLMAKGADVTIKTEFGESVLDLANENEFLKKQNIDLQFLK